MTVRPGDLGRAIQYGDWKREKQLGSGAFGNVYMWKNVETNEEIAIKKCKNTTSDTMRRWQTEMKMIEEMNHPNIVSFIKIPSALSKEYPKHCSLGMEYCSMGDLRKVLSLAEHCCGLPEHHVRDVMMDIGSAIRYLHQKNNMHRDLKPENIVLKPRPGCPGRYQFKVTDLGYAKDLDLNSCGVSFVGTLPYLAPELMFGNGPQARELRYFSQVDYWSFGLVVFECITGYRPFFHVRMLVPAMQALNLVKDKNDDDICAWMDPRTYEKHFHKHIPQPHLLNPEFTEDLVPWLRLMLSVHGEERGGRDGEEWYTLLKNNIFPKRYIKVLNVSKMNIINVKVEENALLHTLKIKIQDQANVPDTEQLLLLKKGDTLTVTERVLNQLAKSNPKSPDEAIIYLFNKSRTNAPSYESEIPAMINQFFDGQNPLSQGVKRFMQISLHDTLSNINVGLHFYDASMALLERISRVSENLNNTLQVFTRANYKTTGMVELFKASLEKDIAENNDQDNSSGICANDNFTAECTVMSKRVQEWTGELLRGQKLIEEAETELSITQSCILSLSELKTFHDTLENLKVTSKKFYDTFRLESKKIERKLTSPSERHEDLENRLKQFRLSQANSFVHDYWKKAYNCLKDSDKFQSRLQLVMKHYTKLESIHFEMMSKQQEYAAILSNLLEKQQSRQHNIWLMLQYMKDVYNTANAYERQDGGPEELTKEIHRLGGLIDGLERDEHLLTLLNFTPPAPTDAPPVALPSSPPETSRTVPNENGPIATLSPLVQNSSQETSGVVTTNGSIRAINANTNNNASRVSYGSSDLEISKG